MYTHVASSHARPRGGALEGWGVVWVSWRIAGPAGLPATPQVGEASWRGTQQVGRAASLFPAPAPARGEGAVGRSDVRVKEGRTSHDKG